MNPNVNDPTRCSNIVFKDFIFDARNLGDAGTLSSVTRGEGFRIDYGGEAYKTDSSTYCNHIQIIGGKIRHGKYVAGMTGYAADVTVTGTELSENGASVGEDIPCTTGEHDHAFYILGPRWTLTNLYVHDNIQGAQIWQPSLTTLGAHVITDNRWDNNELNPWAAAKWSGGGAQCGTGYGVIAMYDEIGSGSIIQRNQISNATEPGIALGGSWGGDYTHDTNATGNWIWNISGSPIAVSYGGSGNVISPNTNGPKP